MRWPGRVDGLARWIHVLTSRSSWLLLFCWTLTIFNKLIYIDIEFEKLLSNEILNELVIVYKFLIINFRSALQFHFLWIVLPFDLNFDQGKADELQHLMWISLELESNMESSSLQLLIDYYLLIPICAERVLWVSMFHRLFISIHVKPLSIILNCIWLLHEVVDLRATLASCSLNLSKLVVFTSLESLMDLV